MKSRTITSAAADQVLAAILGPTWKAKAKRLDIPIDCVRSQAARGLARAQRILARGVSPGEQFTLQLVADQIDADFPA